MDIRVSAASSVRPRPQVFAPDFNLSHQLLQVHGSVPLFGTTAPPSRPTQDSCGCISTPNPLPTARPWAQCCGRTGGGTTRLSGQRRGRRSTLTSTSQRPCTPASPTRRSPSLPPSLLSLSLSRTHTRTHARTHARTHVPSRVFLSHVSLLPGSSQLPYLSLTPLPFLPRSLQVLRLQRCRRAGGATPGRLIIRTQAG